MPSWELPRPPWELLWWSFDPTRRVGVPPTVPFLAHRRPRPPVPVLVRAQDESRKGNVIVSGA